MAVFTASFCIGKEPNDGCVAFLAYKYGSAGSVSFDIIDVHVPNGIQSGRSLFCPKQSGGHRTNGMPGSVRQPDGPQSWAPVREGDARKFWMFTSVVCFSYSPCLSLHSQPCPVAAYSDEEYGRMWVGSNAVGLIGFVLNVYMCITWSDHISYLLSLSLPALHVPFVFLLSTWSLLSCMIVQAPRRKKSISNCALPS